MKLVSLLLLCLCMAQALAVGGEKDSSVSADHEEMLKEELVKEEQDRGAAAVDDVVMLQLRKRLQETLDTLEDLWLPFLPLLSFDTMSLALTEVTVFGLSDVELLDFGFEGLKTVSASLSIPALTLYSGHYIIGGKLIDLPIIGESTANITMKNFTLTFSVGLEGLKCAAENTTTFSLAADDVFVYFANLNPERDEQGVLINTMLESLADDILEWLSIELSPGGSMHDKIDNFIVSHINGIVPGCSTDNTDTRGGNSLPELDLQGKNVIGVLQSIADYLGSVVDLACIDADYLKQFRHTMHS